MKKNKKTLLESDLQPAALPADTENAPLPADGPAVSPRPTFPIVGIGASAGGLEALESFVRNIPPGSATAYVIVQHLDPTHKDIMVELLQRVTPLAVVQVSDGLEIAVDSIYVIPPNRDMSIIHGVLHLLPPAAPRGLRLPIDFFFRTLAADMEERSIGVILSGMGTDGTLGLRAIKERAGTTFVQSPATAKFDGMPRSAMDSGMADVVADAEDLPLHIHNYLRHIPRLVQPDLPLEAKSQSGLEKVCVLLRVQTGHDFSLYKKNSLYRRIERRMGLHQIDKIENYVRLLQENPQETELLFKELLIGVTSFFRDPEAWDRLITDIIPALLAAHPLGGTLRAWTPGCSTGEEAYSLAIAFKEILARMRPEALYSLQIFATDLDKDAIDRARQGVYPANIAADLSAERLRRYFVQEDLGYRVSKEIREMVIFAPQNVAMDPPFTRLDLLVCRNLLIYMSAELQKKLLPLFHYSLNPAGVLFLGSAETIGAHTHLFNSLDSKLRLYRRAEAPLGTGPIEFPSTFSPLQPGKQSENKSNPSTLEANFSNLQTLVEQLLLKEYSPAAVVTNENGDILYISGHTGKYLEPAVGKANLNIFAMAREGLRYDLSSAFQKSLRDQVTVNHKDLVVSTEGGSQALNLTVRPLVEPRTRQGMVLIVFSDHPMPDAGSSARPSGRRSPGLDAKLSRVEQELQAARLEMQSSRDEAQVSQEELKSANEELQSTNEELQSTNEELTTSKEEMQSLNEELQTVNHELQAKLDELSTANNDMKNLLNSTNIATLFLDEGLRVRRFTTQATQIIKLIPGDVGRPVTDIASELIYPELGDDVEQVLRTLVFKEKTVAARDGRWFTMRIMPYRTLDNRIDGVVITFVDISAAKKLENVLNSARDGAHVFIDALPQAFGVFEAALDENGGLSGTRLVFANRALKHFLKKEEAQIAGKTLDAVYPDLAPGWEKPVARVVAGGAPERFEISAQPGGRPVVCSVYRPGDLAGQFCVVFSEPVDPEGL